MSRWLTQLLISLKCFFVSDMMNKKWITNSRTRTALVERYPEGSEVTMTQIEEAYVRLSESKKDDEVKRRRGRHVFLRMLDEGYWNGDSSPYVKVVQDDGISYWAKADSFKLANGVKVKGRVIRFETVSGKMQSVRLERLSNLAELNAYVNNIKG